MGSRFPSHQLSNGLYVSGRREQPKERTPTMTSAPMPYTGGDIKKSGELGKMFDIPVDGSKSRKSGPITSGSSRTGSFAKHSGPINPNAASRTSYSTSGPISSSASVSSKKSNSGPLSKHGEPLKKSSSGPQSTGSQSSGPQASVLPATGLITSGPLNSSGGPRKVSVPLDSKFQGAAAVNSQAVTTLTPNNEYSFKRFIWNSCGSGRATISFITRYPDAELRTAKNGQYVKVSGVVTCGKAPLESSFQRVPRCVYTSTSLYEYRGWDSKAASPTHRRFTWGLRSSQRHVVDFYISDIESGLRVLVKSGYGAKVTPYVDESIVIDVDPSNNELSPELIRWLRERNLSSDDRIMRLKEGYIKEGSTASVIGVVQRNENNVLMIVPPAEPFTTGCQLLKCIFPATLEGIVLRCEEDIDAIPV